MQVHKEANREKDAAIKCNATSKHKATASNNPACKQPQQEVNFCCMCQEDGCNVVWASCKHQNFHHPDYRKPSGTNPCSNVQADCYQDNRHKQNCCCSYSRNDCQDWDCKPAPCNCKEQNYHADDCEHLRSCSCS